MIVKPQGAWERDYAYAFPSCSMNDITAINERQAGVAASSKTPLEIMARWAYDKALELTAVLSGPDAPQSEEAQLLMQEILKFRDAAQRYASAAAPCAHRDWLQFRTSIGEKMARSFARDRIPGRTRQFVYTCAQRRKGLAKEVPATEVPVG